MKVDYDLLSRSDLIEALKASKMEVADFKFQRDKLLEITWLDLPAEPFESTKQWEKIFNEGWMRRNEVSGEAVINAIISGGLCHAICASDKEHNCVVVWSSGAAEQIEATVAK